MDWKDIVLILGGGFLVGFGVGFWGGKRHIKNELHNFILEEFTKARRWSKMPLEMIKIIFDYTNS